MNVALKIPYKCRCLSSEVTVDVRPRRESEDIVSWVEQAVAGAVSIDHRARSPLCAATVMEYVKIPAPENAPYIGGAPKLDA